MPYTIYFDDQPVDAELTLMDADRTARRLMGREPFDGSWWIVDESGETVADYGLVRGTQWAARNPAASRGLPQ